MQAPPPQVNAPQTAPRPFRFLDLHAELRNEIYAIYAAECSTILVHASGAKGRRVVAQHPISQVSRQLRNEFMNELERQTLDTPRDIRARVVDFEFSSLITYLKKVVRRDPQALFEYNSAAIAPHRRRLRVELALTDFWMGKGDVEPLKAWCRFVSVNLRKSPGQNIIWYDLSPMPNKRLTMEHLREFNHDNANPEYAEFGAMLQVWKRYGTAANASRVMVRVDQERKLRRGEYDDDWYDGDLPQIEASVARMYEK